MLMRPVRGRFSARSRLRLLWRKQDQDAVSANCLFQMGFMRRFDKGYRAGMKIQSGRKHPVVLQLVRDPYGRCNSCAREEWRADS
jgi:hypothetical protein